MDEIIKNEIKYSILKKNQQAKPQICKGQEPYLADIFMPIALHCPFCITR